MRKSRNYCEVDGCKSQKSKNTLSFFKFPKEEERRKKWLEVIGRPDLLNSTTKHNYVCSLHFDKSVIRNIPLLKPDAIPTILLPEKPSSSNIPTTTEYKDTSTQTKKTFKNILSAANEGPDIKLECEQTEVIDDKNKVTQISQPCSSVTPRKRKRRGESKESEPKIKEPQIVKKIKEEDKTKE